MSTKLWYSTIGHLETLGLSAFFGVARAFAHALTIFTAVSKRDAVNQDAKFLTTKVLYSMYRPNYFIREIFYFYFYFRHVLCSLYTIIDNNAVKILERIKQLLE